MTAFAVVKVTFSKSAFIVMAIQTAHCAARRKMLGNNRQANLSFLRRACFDRMTIAAIQSLPGSVV
jgi:hypothetical protein